MPKRLASLLALLISISFFLAACGKSTPTQVVCTSPDVLCVGLVTGLEGIKDKSFNQSAWEGILQAQTDKVADQVRYIETVDAKDYEQNIATLANAGYDIIVTVGEQYGPATTAAAKSYPNTRFIGVDQPQAEIQPNLVGLIFHEDQAGFLAGALAAQMTKTGTIAGISSPNQLPQSAALKQGFEAGARYINPTINIVPISSINASVATYSDSAWGASTTTQAIKNGADVVFGAGGKTGMGALVETANHADLYCIGSDTDQWEILPEARPCLITSAVQLISPGVSDLIQLAHGGSFAKGNYYGASGLAPYHDFDSLIPQAVKDKMNQIAVGLTAGSITTGYSSDK
jgi:basic membrane protein A and related proteins